MWILSPESPLLVPKLYNNHVLTTVLSSPFQVRLQRTIRTRQDRENTGLLATHSSASKKSFGTSNGTISTIISATTAAPRSSSKRRVLGTVTNIPSLARKSTNTNGLKHSRNSGSNTGHNSTKNRFNAINKNVNTHFLHHNNNGINIRSTGTEMLADLASRVSSHSLPLHPVQAAEYVTSGSVLNSIDMYSHYSDDDTEVESVPDFNDEDDKSSDVESINEPQNEIINFHDDAGILPQPPYRITISHQCGTNPNALAPVWSIFDCQVMAELDAEFRTKPGVFDENDEDTYDISMVPEYNADIFEYMRILELGYVPNADYMAHQPDITWRMRTLMIDWIVRVHDHCNLLPETLFLTVNYIDRFLSLKPVNEQKLQLVGLVAMFVASKYEEITSPSVKDIAYLADNEYTIDEILRAECYMINLFEFKMGWPGPMSFLRRSSKADDYDSDVRTLAKYLLELTVMEPRLISAPASWLAAAAHYLALHVLERGPWSKAHSYFSGYPETVLRPAVKLIVECCRHPQTHHRSIFKKYSETRFRCVSMLVSDWMATGTSELF